MTSSSRSGGRNALAHRRFNERERCATLMKCKQCGTEIAEGAAFCQACGAALAAEASDPPLTPRDRLRPSAGADSDDSEVPLWEGRFSKRAMVGWWVMAGVLTVAAVVAASMLNFTDAAWFYTLLGIGLVWVALVAWLLYQQWSVSYSLTSQRLIHEHGILWRHTDRIETIDISDVSLHQGPIERMLGVGTVKLLSSDESTPHFQLVGIDDARRVATLIDEARRQERRKRGLHVESI